MVPAPECTCTILYLHQMVQYSAGTITAGKMTVGTFCCRYNMLKVHIYCRYNLVRVQIGAGTFWCRYNLVQVQFGAGTICRRYNSVQVQSGAGRYTLVQVHFGAGTLYLHQTVPAPYCTCTRLYLH
jgi:hypothetical protein